MNEETQRVEATEPTTSNKALFLGSDKTTEGVEQIHRRVDSLLYGTTEPGKGSPTLYTRREVVAPWDGYEFCANYYFEDGRIVEEYRGMDDHGEVSTGWTLYPAPAPRPYKTWHGDFEQPHL